jgi:hypothetical protein
MKNFNLLASLLGLAAASSAVNVPDTNLEARQDPDDLLIFVCNDGLDEICTNMCYGINNPLPSYIITISMTFQTNAVHHRIFLRWHRRRVAI